MKYHRSTNCDSAIDKQQLLCDMSCGRKVTFVSSTESPNEVNPEFSNWRLRRSVGAENKMLSERGRPFADRSRAEAPVEGMHARPGCGDQRLVMGRSEGVHKQKGNVKAEENWGAGERMTCGENRTGCIREASHRCAAFRQMTAHNPCNMNCDNKGSAAQSSAGRNVAETDTDGGSKCRFTWNRGGKLKFSAWSWWAFVIFHTHVLKALAEGDVAPYFKTEPSLSEIHLEGNRLVLTCLAEGSWPLEFKWMLNNSDITSFSPQYKYTIPSLQRSDVGSYQCVVRNRMGTLMQRRAEIQVAYMGNFVETEQRKTVSLGRAAVISPPAISCFPRPQVTWFRDGYKIIPSDRV